MLLKAIIKRYPLILMALLLSFIAHFFFIRYFPVEWFDEILGGGKNWHEKMAPQPEKPIEIQAFLEDSGNENRDLLGSGNGQSEDGKGDLTDVDQEKWGDLLERLDENAGFEQDFIQSYDQIIPENNVSDSYINRDRRHEDIVVKEVFPTIYDIEKPFTELLESAPEILSDYNERNQIIEQYRGLDSSQDMALEIQKAQEEKGNLGPLHFPPDARQRYFDQTIKDGKTEQLSRFIKKYFQYDPDEGDLAVATRELYQKNLERILYTFSSDPNYFYLDFYLENLNKEDFLNNALNQAAKLQGSRTATELLFSLERIYEIQQRAWGTYFDFEAEYPGLSEQQKKRLRVETLRRANAHYKEVLTNKNIENYAQIQTKYLQRRFEVLNHLVKTTPREYRLRDALFERAVVEWEIGRHQQDEQRKALAIKQWKSLIQEAKAVGFSEKAFQASGFSEEQYGQYQSFKHLRAMEGIIAGYERAQPAQKANREQAISNYLRQRFRERYFQKQKREAELLWPRNSGATEK